MTVRVNVAPSVLSWALDVTGADDEALHRRFKVDDWLSADVRPTSRRRQVSRLATCSCPLHRSGHFLCLTSPRASTVHPLRAQI